MSGAPLSSTGQGQAAGYRDAVASPHTLTSQTAMAILSRGGNAVDAAIAANAVQGAVAPETCGIGGDLFALVWIPGRAEPVALNASGWAGSNVSASSLRAAGLEAIPNDHPASVSIPGAVAGWFMLAEQFGSIDVGTLLQPAIQYASEGFPASSEFVRATTARKHQLQDQPSGAELLLPDMAVGARIRRPLHAATLERICASGRDGFYTGPVAEDIARATGNLVTVDDLAAYRPELVDPIGAEVLGSTGWTIGPNSQGYVTLAALRIMEMTGIEYDPDDGESHHTLIEAYRAVARERDEVVTDARHAPMSGTELLDDSRLGAISAEISGKAGSFERPAPKPGGTAFLCVVDKSGIGVSLIQSNFHGLGSGIGAGRSGFLLHNRGAGANLAEGHPNELMPGKRPLHTLSPTVWSREGSLTLVLGTRGGHQQPQLLAQVAANHLAHRDQLWKAQARPRWHMSDVTRFASSSLSVEAAMSGEIISDLRARGHHVDVVSGPTGGWGPVSMISVDESGLRTSAADPRVDTSSAVAS